MAQLTDAVLPDLQGTEEGRLFEKEIYGVLGGEKRDHPCYIGGFKIGSGQLFYLASPIDETIRYGSFQEAERGTMTAAVDAALEAAPEWASLPAEARAAYLRPYLNGLRARRLHYAALVTVASGMTREDALVEVDSLIAALEEIMEKAPSAGAGRGGVWAVITEHNSPLAAPVAYAAAAMVAGNAVVMYPSNRCPMPVYDFYSTTERSGLPGGVLNLVVDKLEDESTAELANDMRLRGVVASGSGDRMEDMMFLQVDDELRFVNNLKGMSPCIVYRPSDMREAARQIIESAFSYSGQRIHSCSKVIVVAEDQKRLMDALIECMKDLKVGDPVNDGTFTGPVISAEAAERFNGLYADNAAFVISRAPRCLDMDSPSYVSPMILSGLDEDNELVFMDSGLPILCVKVVADLDRAFEELSDTECGMSAGIYTKDAKAISRMREEADAPVIYVNESTRRLSPVVGLDLDRFRGPRPWGSWPCLRGLRAGAPCPSYSGGPPGPSATS